MCEDGMSPQQLIAQSETALEEYLQQSVVGTMDDHLVEFSEALGTVAKALRRVAESKARAQEEAAEWRRKYELEHLHNLKLQQKGFPTDEEQVDASNKESEHSSQQFENGNSIQDPNGQCCGRLGICSEEILQRQASNYDLGIGSNSSTGKALFMLVWGSNGDKSKQHKHDVVSFESGDITTAVRSSKQIMLKWESPPQSVIILTKPNSNSVRVLCTEMIRWLREQKNVTIFVEPRVKKDLLAETMYFDFVQTWEKDEEILCLHKKIDLVITLGGDGTVLWAASMFKGPVPPVISFSLGSLGFMTPFRILLFIVDGEVKIVEGPLSKGMLESNKCYLLDCGAEIYVWVGRVTQLEERKAASLAAEEFVSNQKRSKHTRITRIIQGFETLPFKSNFDSWPVGSGTSGSEDGRGKVAALLKQQGVDVKGMLKATPVNEEIPPLLEGNGKLEVWRVNNNAKVPVSREEIGKFYSGDCYIVLYTYHSGDRKENYFLCFWLGQHSTPDEQTAAARLTNTMANSLKGKPAQGRIVQGKEPAEFIGLFPTMIILKGGLSSGYKRSIVEKALNDETYTTDCLALIQIYGSAPHNSKAVQVDPVATSLNSADCFLLQSGSSLFVWHGNSSTLEQQQLAARIAEFLKPGVSLKHAKEGTEAPAFWYALGGKQSYVSKRATQEPVRDPHLYACTFEKGILEITEVFNFSQDDLLTEDIMILDTHGEVFVWVGQHADAKEKQRAFEIGQKYMERATLLEGLSPDVPLFKVTEGNEPPFFTKFFVWESTKAAAQGNSFEKKLATLQGIPIQAMEGLKKRVLTADTGSSQSSSQISDRSNGLKQGGPTQRASALAALSSAFNSSSESKRTPRPIKPYNAPLSQSSQRAAAVAALSTVLKAEPKSSQAQTSLGANKKPYAAETVLAITKNVSGVTGSAETEELGPKRDELSSKDGAEVEESASETNCEETSKPKEDEAKPEENGTADTYSYERLKTKSTNPAPGIDYKRREMYLSPEEFQTIFGMNQKTFYEQPKWKQDMRKKAADLF